MTTDDPRPLDLTALGPDPAWTDALPALGAAGAQAYAEAVTWTAQVGRHARWFVPLAAATAAALWLWAGRAAPPPSAPATATAPLVAGPADGASVVGYLIGGGP